MVVVLWLVVQFCLPSPASAVLVHASTSSLSLLCVVGEAASASEPALVDKKGSLFVQQLWNFTRSILFRRFKSSWVSSCLLFLQEFSLLLCVTFRVLIGFRNKTWCVLMKFLGRSALYITQLVLERPILLTWTEKTTKDLCAILISFFMHCEDFEPLWNFRFFAAFSGKLWLHCGINCFNGLCWIQQVLPSVEARVFKGLRFHQKYGQFNYSSCVFYVFGV